MNLTKIEENHYSIQISDLPQNHNAPGLSLCRKLLKLGYCPETKITFLRGTCCSFYVHSIGEGAKWTVKETKDIGPIFVRYTEKEIYNEKTRDNVS